MKGFWGCMLFTFCAVFLVVVVFDIIFITETFDAWSDAKDGIINEVSVSLYEDTTDKLAAKLGKSAWAQVFNLFFKTGVFAASMFVFIKLINEPKKYNHYPTTIEHNYNQNPKLNNTGNIIIENISFSKTILENGTYFNLKHTFNNIKLININADALNDVKMLSFVKIDYERNVLAVRKSSGIFLGELSDESIIDLIKEYIDKNLIIRVRISATNPLSVAIGLYS